MPAQTDSPAVSAGGDFSCLIDAPALIARLQAGSQDLLVVDCRFDLADPARGRAQYDQGHVPGATYAHLEADLSAPRGPATGRHPLPARAEFANWASRRGITPQTTVVAYDDSGGCYAARLWWMLRWIGHERVCLLDGGWKSWQALGAGTSDAHATCAPAGMAVCSDGPDRSLAFSVDAQAVLAIVDGADPDPRRVVLDARAADRYAGQNETIDPVAGHIPGAIQAFWRDSLGPDERFKTPAELRQHFARVTGGRNATQIVCQCGSGVTACHLLFSLHLAGMEGAALYPGSWSEWITDPTRPVRTGPMP